MFPGVSTGCWPGCLLVFYANGHRCKVSVPCPRLLLVFVVGVAAIVCVLMSIATFGYMPLVLNVLLPRIRIIKQDEHGYIVEEV